MKLALQYEMQRPSLDDHLVLQETMEQCILADEVGFDYLWFVEHHFLTGFSASPCPDLVYAALSQRTKQIRLGLGVVILPYHHPNRVAERVAMLDHLSEGRVDFGTGRSAPYELTGMGIDPRDSREMWEESLSMVPDIWQTDLYSHEGKYWQVPERQILPKPYQNPHPPIWVAALQPSTYEIAASKGIGVLSFGSSAPSSLEPHVKAYRENVKKAKPVGAFVNDQWASSTLGVCLEKRPRGEGDGRAVAEELLRSGQAIRAGAEGCVCPASGQVGRRAGSPEGKTSHATSKISKSRTRQRKTSLITRAGAPSRTRFGATLTQTPCATARWLLRATRTAASRR